MICNTIGLTADSYQSMYVHGGDEVAEVYGGINYADPIFYKSQTMTGSAPLVYDSYPGGLTDYTILGNSYQDGVPDPDNPVEVVSVGDKTENLLDPYADGWELESIINDIGVVVRNHATFFTDVSPFIEIEPGKTYSVCNRNSGSMWCHAFYNKSKQFISSFPGYGTGDTSQTATAPANAKYLRCSILSINYSPQYRYTKAMVTQTASIPDDYIPYGYKIPITCGGVTQNIYLDEPLRKQLNGDAADELNYATQTLTRRVDASCDPLQTPTTEPITLPQIQTISGQNTLMVNTTLQPSQVSITGHIKPTGYGQLADSNNVDILDSNGTSIFVHGQGGTT